MIDHEGFGRRFRRWMSPVKRWIGGTSTRLFVALGLLVFITLMLPGTFSVLFGNIWSCLRGRMTCSASDFWWEAAAFVGIGVLYLVGFLALRELVGTVLWSRMRVVAGRESRCRALIMGLSELRPLDREVLDYIKAAFRARTPAYGLPKIEFERSVAASGEPSSQRLAIQWQQNVRSALHHGAGLRVILVLPSQESLAQWTEFKSLMDALFPDLRIDLVRGSDGEPFKLPELPGEPVRSYEDYTYLFEGLSLAVEQVQGCFAKGEHGGPIDDREVCIDVTAGPKTFSIAGAIVTLNSDLKLGYVSTGGVVTIFDAEIGMVDSLTRTLRMR